MIQAVDVAGLAGLAAGFDGWIEMLVAVGENVGYATALGAGARLRVRRPHRRRDSQRRCLIGGERTHPPGRGLPIPGMSRRAVAARIRCPAPARPEGSSSIWQSSGLQNRRLGVRVPPALLRTQTNQTSPGLVPGRPMR